MGAEGIHFGSSDLTQVCWPESAFQIGHVGETTMDSKKQMEALVAKGLRAQLKTGSLLTGQLYVDWDFQSFAARESGPCPAPPAP